MSDDEHKPDLEDSNAGKFCTALLTLLMLTASKLMMALSKRLVLRSSATLFFLQLFSSLVSFCIHVKYFFYNSTVRSFLEFVNFL